MREWILLGGGGAAMVILAALILVARDFLDALSTDQAMRLRGHPWRRRAKPLQAKYAPGMGATGHQLSGAIGERTFRLHLEDTESGRVRATEASLPDSPLVSVISIAPRILLASELLFEGSAREAEILSRQDPLRGAESLAIAADGVQVRFRGTLDRRLSSCLHAAAALCTKLEVATELPWQQSEQRFGLTRHDEGGERAMGGLIEGRSVRVSTERAPTGERETHIAVGLFNHLTMAPFSIRIRDGDRGEKIGQPILDRLVQLEGQPDPALLERLRWPETCGALLAVVHAWPGSTVDWSEIRTRLPGRASEGLVERLDEALTLADLLEGRRTESAEIRD